MLRNYFLVNWYIIIGSRFEMMEVKKTPGGTVRITVMTILLVSAAMAAGEESLEAIHGSLFPRFLNGGDISLRKNVSS